MLCLNGVNNLINYISIIFGCLSLILITWWFHYRKHMLLTNRLKKSDEGLLTEPGLKIESVFQAPPGSVIYPYIIVNEDTTRVPEEI